MSEARTKVLPPHDGSPTYIAGLAEKILATLHLVNITQLTRFSILTTAFANHMKTMMRQSSVIEFEETRSTFISLLDKLKSDLLEMKPTELKTDARNSEDGQSAPGQDGKTH